MPFDPIGRQSASEPADDMWLVGMMGSGKTTVGEKVASRLGVEFFDTDRMVVAGAGMSIPEIWNSVGEAGFRELEHRAVLAVPTSGCVAAAGGGAILLEQNRTHIELGAPVVWLRTTPVALAGRLEVDGERPLLRDETSGLDRLTEILETRLPLYESVATHTLDTDDLSVDQTADEVVRIWESA